MVPLGGMGYRGSSFLQDEMLGSLCKSCSANHSCDEFMSATVCVYMLSVCWGLFSVSGRHHFAAHFSILALTFFLELAYYLTAVPTEAKDSTIIYSQHLRQL